MRDRLYSAYISVSPAAGEPRVETLLPVLLSLGLVPRWPAPRADWLERKAILDECDYLILLCGHSYVISSPAGVSWQHRELNYANVRQLPVFTGSLDEQNLPAELGKEEAARLGAFRQQLGRQYHLVWQERRDIPKLLEQTWADFLNTHPTVGWVRGQSAGRSTAITTDVPLPRIKGVVEGTREVIPDENLLPLLTQPECQWLQDREAFSFYCQIYAGGNCTRVSQSGILSWQEISRAFATPLQPSGSEDRIERSLGALLEKKFTASVLAQHLQAHAATDFVLTETSLRKIRLKMRRSGLVRKDTRASGRHTQVWALTTDGEKFLKNCASMV
ncbi:hypothetical protein [Parendozoicomonas haliclonae]|uniref:DUF4062 domain-containing protein n=1 Tax=Parendozoicomonas haliclonae TaxID=1960125 RepID=A0A1X7AMI5_9GAMM|nr:hypothetical protein [Parendozoicomonas haliclonae]SMA49488.1 hypothetical protein EHSB41UT_03286 [Parendozoicomonas haliclonae]